MAGAGLTARPTREAGRRPDWRDSQAFSGEFDETQRNETRPRTGSTAHLVLFCASSGRKPRETLWVSRAGEGAKMINSPISRIDRVDVIQCLTY